MKSFHQSKRYAHKNQRYSEQQLFHVLSPIQIQVYQSARLLSFTKNETPNKVTIMVA
jgi:hypothetical protein